MSGEYEKLSNVNASTAKHAQWLVRVLAPRLTEYLFWARGEEVNATRFSAILIAQDDSEYLPVAVKFEFSDTQAPSRAYQKFVENSVWIMTKPTFDPKADPKYNSSSVSGVLLLSATKMTAVPPVNVELCQKTATSLDVGLDLDGILKALEGQAVTASKKVDLCGKVLDMGSVKSITKPDKTMRVQELTLADRSGARIQVSVWDHAIKLLQNIHTGNELTFLSVTAKRDTNNDGKIKLNASEHVNVLLGRTKAQSVTDVVVDKKTSTTPTSTFVLGSGQHDVSKGAIAQVTNMIGAQKTAHIEVLGSSGIWTVWDIMFKIKCEWGVPTSDQTFFMGSQMLSPLQRLGSDHNICLEFVRRRPKCSLCHKNQSRFATKLSFCPKCKAVQYCDVKCQVAHWESHRPHCQEWRASASKPLEPMRYQ